MKIRLTGRMNAKKRFHQLFGIFGKREASVALSCFIVHPFSVILSFVPSPVEVEGGQSFA